MKVDVDMNCDYSCAGYTDLGLCFVVDKFYCKKKQVRFTGGIENSWDFVQRRSEAAAFISLLTKRQLVGDCRSFL